MNVVNVPNKITNKIIKPKFNFKIFSFLPFSVGLLNKIKMLEICTTITISIKY